MNTFVPIGHWVIQLSITELLVGHTSNCLRILFLCLYQCFFVFIKNITIFTVVVQEYSTGSADAYVIVGNSALIRCEIPSFVADFVSVVSWSDNDSDEYFSLQTSYGIY
jgi:hypothetical protein